MLNAELRRKILDQLGSRALRYIASGHPYHRNGYIYFWVYGQEVAWGIDTDPVLLLWVKPDQEFRTFSDLVNEITSPV